MQFFSRVRWRKVPEDVIKSVEQRLCDMHEESRTRVEGARWVGRSFWTYERAVNKLWSHERYFRESSVQLLKRLIPLGVQGPK